MAGIQASKQENVLRYARPYCAVLGGKGSRGKGTDGDRPDHVDVLCVVCNACLSVPSDYYFLAFVGFGVSCPWFYGKFP
jgi:hypothetical protein